MGPVMSPEELRRTFVLANEFKEGDRLVGGTDDPADRAEARRSIAAMRLRDIVSAAFVDDGVSEALDRSLSRPARAAVSNLTVGELQRILLSPACADWLRRHRDGLPSEAIAAVVKVMTAAELSTVARRLFNPLPGDGTTVGAPQHLGSRIQPNSAGDDEEEILCSILEGLAYGCGDVIIGLNPASDDVETIVRLEALLRQVVDRLQLPTRYCVLSDIVKQTRARERGPVDVGFQSLAGYVDGAARHGRTRRRGRARSRARLFRLLLRNRTGIRRHQRRGGRRRHGDARGPRLRRRSIPAARDGCVDDRQRCRRLYRTGSIQDR